MIYFDFSATTIPSKEVLEKFYIDNLKYPGNANSSHNLGNAIRNKICESSGNILKLLKLDDNYEVVYTSGSSEANNLAITGLALKNKDLHIISTPFEHSSILAPISALQKKGYSVEFVNLLENGMVDLNHLQSLLDDRVTLVSISSVNSELGICQNLLEIKNIIRKYPKAYFHCDATQSIGKVDLSFDDLDLISFSAHKFYGLKGVGALVKKKNISLDSIIKGGKSTTKYRSGTPAHPLIFSLNNALELAYTNIKEKIIKVKSLNDYLRNKLDNINLKKLQKVIIFNSNEYSIPHIVNFSVLGLKSIDIVNALSNKEIYISNHSACSSDKELSFSVMSLTHDEKRALSSIRISLSYLNTYEEIDALINAIKELIK